MTNEEKIKAYDKALERAKSLIGDTIIEESGQHIAEVIFPELKDSENKRIKEDIISYIKVANQIIPQLQIDKWITWLEKQGIVIKDTISMDVDSETEWDDIHKFLRMNLDGEKVKLLIIRGE